MGQEITPPAKRGPEGARLKPGDRLSTYDSGGKLLSPGIRHVESTGHADRMADMDPADVVDRTAITRGARTRPGDRMAKRPQGDIELSAPERTVAKPLLKKRSLTRSR